MKPKFISAFLSFFLALQLFSQTSKKDEAKLQKTIYYYQFEGAKLYEEVSELKSMIISLKGVTEFKPVFKAEKNMAQIIVVVQEKTRTSESDKLFEITDLKKILENKGYKNLEYTFEEAPIN